ncbi:T9SS type A sorting domain-containing protein [uncultured Aquimarina sp.]|uniref:carbohydrate-binding domain-containing protein n=1 Tax=uncultured Aquimarina sp. TaxID=575652 RepID=UPI00261B3966|nr:T9SS type A sorting domain-containing protein [uncultured Aquimarina sp.]
MKKLKLVLVLFLIQTIYLSAQSTYYVNATNGNDNNSGLSQSDAFQSITNASTKVSPGDTIKVLPGIYTGEMPVNLYDEVLLLGSGAPGNYVTYQGIPDSNGNLPKIISNSRQGLTISSGSYMIIENFEVVSGNEDVKGIINNSDFGIEFYRGRSGISLVNSSHHIIVRNNYVHDFPGGGINVGGGDVVLFEENLVEHCGFGARNATSGMGTYQMADLGGAPFPEYPNHRVIFKNNISRYNINLRGFEGSIGNNRVTDGNGIIIDDHLSEQSNNPIPYSGRTLLIGNICYGNGGRGINLFSSNNIDVYNNTLFDNAQTTRIPNPPYEIAIADSQLFIGLVDNANIKNNIFYNGNESRTTIDTWRDSNITYSNNIHWNVNGNPIPIDNNDIIANPRLNSVTGLTSSQTNLFGTLTNPYNENSTSALVRLPTSNNNFPIQNMALRSNSPAIDAGQNVGFGNPVDIGALPFGDNTPIGNNDDIISVSAPETVTVGTTVDVKVTYSASTNRDVQVAFQSVSAPNYTVYGETIVRVSEGSGTITVRVPISANTPIASDEYQFQTFITTSDGGWPNSRDNIAKIGIDTIDSSSGDFSTISIGAEGTCGGEKIQLLLNNQIVAEWVLTTDINFYSYNQYLGNENIKVAFVNDAFSSSGCDLNATIDWIQICGELYQTENYASRTGCGSDQSLFCNGNFDFGNLNCIPNNRNTLLDQKNVKLSTFIKLHPNPTTHSRTSIMGLQEGKKYRLRLYDISGKVILTEERTAASSTITLDNLTSGLYILQLIDALTSKVIKTSKLLVN